MTTSEKTLKFADPLAEMIARCDKVTTWRIKDDKDLSPGDRLRCLQSSTGRLFCVAAIVEVEERTFGTLKQHDFEGHEPVGTEDEMLTMYSNYYDMHVTPDTSLKVVRFEPYLLCNQPGSDDTDVFIFPRAVA